MRRRTKWVLLMLLALNGLLLPLGWLALNLVFWPGFLIDIYITNATAEPIDVTPVGVVDATGSRRLLPTVHSRQPPYYPPAPASGLRIEPGATRTVVYDWDDINFSEIVVTLRDGSTGQLVVNPTPTQGMFCPPTPRQFTVTETVLTPVPPAVAAAAASRPPRAFLTRPLLAALGLPWLSFPALLVLYDRHRRLSRVSLTGIGP